MDALNEYIIDFIEGLGVWGPILCCFLIVIESILPILPLFVFITINCETFGLFIGYSISYVFAIIGCLLSFSLCRYCFRNYFERKFRTNSVVNKLMIKFDNIKYKTLTLIIAIPFTPAFLINIAAGLSKIKFKKYFLAIIVGKIFLVLFWGFVGTSFIDSLKHPEKLIYTLVILLAAYLVSAFVSKKFDLN